MIDRKPFNPVLNEADRIARNVMLGYFRMRGMAVEEHPNNKDIDLVHEETGTGFELEMINKWTGGDYPYELVNILERKWHLFNGSHPLNNYFIILCKDCNQFIAISQAKIQKYLNEQNCQPMPCNVPTEGRRIDNVCRIPLSEFKIVEIQNN